MYVCINQVQQHKLWNPQAYVNTINTFMAAVNDTA